MSGFDKVMIACGRDAADGSLFLLLRSLAAALGVREVHAVTVASPDEQNGCFPTSGSAMAAELEDSARGTLGPVPACRIVSAVLHGNVLDALLHYATEQRIDLLIVGHRRENASRRLARRLARHAPCAVLMVPDGAPPRIENVLVPVDFSEASRGALDAATDLCRGLGLPRCRVLNVFSRGDTHSPDEDRLIRGDEQREMTRFLGERSAAGVAIEPIFEDAVDVATGVMRVRDRSGADLICMSSRGRSRAAAVLLGSATEDVLDSAPCPVLVVRAPGRPLSLFKVLAQRIFTSEDRPRLG